jgi:hypothetical protein
MEPRAFVFSTISTLILFNDKNERIKFENPARRGFEPTPLGMEKLVPTVSYFPALK